MQEYIQFDPVSKSNPIPLFYQSYFCTDLVFPTNQVETKTHNCHNLCVHTNILSCWVEPTLYLFHPMSHSNNCDNSNDISMEF